MGDRLLYTYSNGHLKLLCYDRLISFEFSKHIRYGVFFIHLEGARVILDILFNKNDTSLFYRIKTLVREY